MWTRLISVLALVTVSTAAGSSLGIRHRTDCDGTTQTRWMLCGLYQITQTESSIGGPQALEGYTRTAHQAGTVAMVLGTIGNVELGGGPASRTTYSAAVSAGTVVSDAGPVDRAVGVSITAPARLGAYAGPMNVTRYDYLALDRWSFRPLGDQGLQLCDPTDHCVDLAALMRLVDRTEPPAHSTFK